LKIEVKKDIILPAWELIKDDSKIKKLQFFPGVLSIIFLSALLAYQTIYTYSVLSHKKEETLEKILNFVHSQYIKEFLIWAIIFIIFYILLTPIFEWAVIKYIQKKEVENKAEISEAFTIWLYKFLPVFEYNNLFSEFKLLSILNFYLFMLRFFEFQYIKAITYSFIIVFLFSLLINILFNYSKYFIVLENSKVFEAIWKSTKLALMNIWNTFKLYFIMFILNIRVIFNFILFLIFPIILVSVVGFLTSQLLQTIAITILIILFVIFLLFLWYLAWVLESLKIAIWYYAYKKWKQKMEEIEKEI